MKSFKLFLALPLICLFSRSQSKPTIDPDLYSADQKNIAQQAFNHPPLLIADVLRYVNPEHFINPGYDILTKNIYFSNIKATDLLPPAWVNTSNDSAALKIGKLLAASAELEKSMALYLAYQGDYSSSILYYEHALLKFNLMKDEFNKKNVNHNLSWLYYAQQEFKPALRHINSTIEMVKETGTRAELIECLIYKSGILLALGDVRSAEDIILKQSLSLCTGNKKREQECYLQLGKIYLEAKRYTEAKWFCIQSSSLAERNNFRTGKIESLLLLAKVKISIKDYGLALQDLMIVGRLMTDQNRLFKPDLQLELAQTYSFLHQQENAQHALSQFNFLKSAHL